MLLGYHTSGLQNHRLDEALRLLADHGYEWVALTPDIMHLDPFHSTPRRVERIAALLQQLGLGVTVETGARYVLDPVRKHEPTLMSRDAAAVERRIDFYARCARLGVELSARQLSFWAGVDREPGPDSATRLLDGVRRTVDAVRDAGLQPSFEPEPGMAVADMAAFAAMCESLGAAAPALTLDVGHLYVTEASDPVQLIRRWAADCAQVHLEDIRRGVHEHLPPGAGDVDFSAVLDALHGGGYPGPVCFELSRSSHRGPELVADCAELWRRWRDGGR